MRYVWPSPAHDASRINRPEPCGIQGEFAMEFGVGIDTHVSKWDLVRYADSIGYRPDLMQGVTVESWADLWRPEFKGKLAAPDFDPSHLITVAAILSGGDAAKAPQGDDEVAVHFKFRVGIK